ncbi:MAG: hypothetical protein EOP56_01665 [Sphingobacteriales bacterium]|nr:MAG: hypothetical protein EOP56_01665 [Sphingobacteriales bacterium]
MLARKNLTRYTNILFTIYIITLLVCSIFFFFRIRVMENTFDSINRTVEVKLNLEKVLSSLRDAETAQRGFLITRDTTFLEHYDEAYQNVFHAIEELRHLTTDQPGQLQNTAQLSDVAKKRFIRLQNTMENDSFLLANRTFKRENLLMGRQVMTEARDLIQKMNGIEDQQLEEQKKRKDSVTELTPLYTLGIFLFSLVVIIICYILMMRRHTAVAGRMQQRKERMTARHD